MITVSGPTQPGGGPGSNLWKFITGTAGDIELNSGDNVTGINAPNPADGNLRLVLNSDEFGVSIGGFVVNDAANTTKGVSVIAPSGGSGFPSYVPQLELNNTGSNENYAITFSADAFNVLAAMLQYRNNASPFTLQVAASPKGFEVIRDGNESFSISPEGHIITDQFVSAPGATPATIIGTVAIFKAGTRTIIGHIPIVA